MSAFIDNADSAHERRYSVAWVSPHAEAALQAATMTADGMLHPEGRCGEELNY